MANLHKIQGTVSYQDIGPGFWSIIDDQGRKWRPVKMPKELRKAGIKGTFEIEEVEEGMSVFMWGVAVKVVGFVVIGD
ncbi:MAG: hypothetical protein IPL49_14060 [Saprospirales bacterium]|nr:hypothetical protein [Saprospirales bacterium]MBK8491970.1 hypothetical protein [Saprospirales bacterium]